MEHPADPGRDPLPSIWATAEWLALAARRGLVQATFAQCRFGAVSAKPTTLAASGPGVARLDGLRCPHGGHPPLIGVDAGGAFRTKAAQAYPSGLCRELAALHLEEMLARGPLAGRVPLCGALLGRAAASLEAERGQHLPVPPIADHWSRLERWRLLFSWKWADAEHINLLELRAVLAAVRHVARQPGGPGRRHLVFVDSQVTLGAGSKGRSSRPA
eukprot:7407711-Lingulodinium_polyedra.AAC.1